MTSRGFIAALVLALGAGWPMVADAQTPPPPLPTAQQVLDRFVEAIGGRETLARQTARHMWGRVEVPSQGLKGPIEVWAAAPAKMFVRTEITGLGESTSGFDGETAWVNNTAMGAMILEGRALDQIRQQADFHAQLHPERHFTAMEVLAETTFEGKMCWQVKRTTRWGEEYTEYFDKETSLLHAAVRSQETPMGALQATTVLEDYRPYGGVLAPSVVRVKVMGIEQVIRTDSVAVGPIPDSVFALPQAIRALKKGG